MPRKSSDDASEIRSPENPPPGPGEDAADTLPDTVSTAQHHDALSKEVFGNPVSARRGGAGQPAGASGGASLVWWPRTWSNPC